MHLIPESKLSQLRPWNEIVAILSFDSGCSSKFIIAAKECWFNSNNAISLQVRLKEVETLVESEARPWPDPAPLLFF